MALERVVAFFDASVLIAAACGSAGSSALTMEVCRRQKLSAVVTGQVLQEAVGSITDRLDGPQLARFCRQIAGLEPEIVGPAAPSQITRLVPIAGEDAHALASALECRAVYFFTLSPRLLNAGVFAKGLPILVVEPREYLRGAAAENHARVPPRPSD